MKIILTNITFLVLCSTFSEAAIGQYNWKLSKEKDGIRIFQSDVQHSNIKCIKVECTLEGNYDKLVAVLNDVNHQKDWVYNNKNAYLLKRISPDEFYYYSETYLPWPMSNRDAVVHLKMNKDKEDRYLKISAVSEPNYIPVKKDKVRVPRLNISWYVTMPASQKINIVYIFDGDPGGNIPSWLVNMFTDKGPYETFKKLSELLKRMI
jgi:hypothetical protein